MSFGDTQLVPCESAKNLGVVLDSSLSFRFHIDSITVPYYDSCLYWVHDTAPPPSRRLEQTHSASQ